jgi:hypothetical protein
VHPGVARDIQLRPSNHFQRRMSGFESVFELIERGAELHILLDSQPYHC